MQSGDGWTVCAVGHRHWGLYGAAGLLVNDSDRVILQHRAPWTHEGGAWGVPGGARNSDESAVAAALREAGEEAGLSPQDVEPIGLFIADHGGWSYVTVVAKPRRSLQPRAVNAESVSVEWIPISEVDSLTLHSGFAAAWPYLRSVPDALRILIGPEIAAHPLIDQIATDGLSAENLPSGVSPGQLHRMLVQIDQVSDRAEAAQLMSRHSAGGQTLTVFDSSDLDLLR
jgi:8-oxo-dGTP diphosphatase